MTYVTMLLLLVVVILITTGRFRLHLGLDEAQRELDEAKLSYEERVAIDEARAELQPGPTEEDHLVLQSAIVAMLPPELRPEFCDERHVPGTSCPKRCGWKPLALESITTSRPLGLIVEGYQFPQPCRSGHVARFGSYDCVRCGATLPD